MTERKDVRDLSDDALFCEWEGLVLSVGMGAQIGAPGPTAEDDSRIEEIEREMERRGMVLG